MKQFSRKTTQRLKHYVYALVDPSTERVIYIGKGSGSKRPFEHLKTKASANTNLNREIREIRAASKEPRVDILRHGLDAKTAHEIEATLIDTIGIHKLANENSGSGSSERGRLAAPQVEAHLGGEPLEVSEIVEPVILFYRKDAYPANRLYDETRQFWKLSESRVRALNDNGELKYQLAFAMRGSFVLEVYQILAWFEAGTTVSSRVFKPADEKMRWEFVGSMADDKTRRKYVNKSLFKEGKPLHATQIGFRYLG